MSKVASLHGRVIFSFDWSRATYEPLAGMARAHTAMERAAGASQAKLEQLSNSPDFTAQGRKNQLREWFHAEGVEALKLGRNAIAAADTSIAKIRADMQGSAVDKSDLAGALLRQEIRSHYRQMEPAKRNAKLSGVEDLDPIEALAIIEAPASLTGVTEEQRNRLESQSLAALNPDAGRKVSEIEEAKEALMTTIRAASQTMMQAAGYTPRELDEALGGPSFADRMASITEGVA